MKKLFLIFVVLLFGTSTFAQVDDGSDEILGVWLTGNKDAKVEIFKEEGKYFGKIIWLKNPLNENGKEKLDKHNPEEELQKRPILGLKLLTDFVYDEDYEWEDGEIYDPKSGKTYSCNMEFQDENKDILEVRGYIGFSLLGRTQEWVRVKD